jgi:membrane-bound lytic murein transglycosylase D
LRLPGFLLAAIVVLSGCALTPAGTGVPPETLDSPGGTAAERPGGGERAAPAARDRLLPDSLAELLRIRDSLADAVALAQLEDAHPPALADAGPGPTSLDLATWADHPRVLYYLDFFQGPARARMEIWLTRMPVYEPMIRDRLRAGGLPEDLLYLALIESGYSNVAVSRSRAVGMWQFMLATARWMGLRVDAWVDERRDPVKATDAAARYLGMLTQQFGSHFLAAAAYNGGPGRVSRGLERLGPALLTLVDDGPDGEGATGWLDEHFFTLADTRHIMQETKDYVPKLIAAALIARSPEAYGFPPIPEVEPFPRDSIVVPDMTGLDVIARLAGVPIAVIRELNPHFLRQATPPGPTVVRLPAGTMEAVTAAYAALPPRERVTFREHVVGRGETMSGIAQRYGVALALLRDANPSVRPERMRIGQVLVVPVGGVWRATAPAAAPAPVPAAGAVHVVRRGETLSSIARQYGTTVDRLRALNHLPASGLIQTGQRLRVSGTAAAASAPPAEARVHIVQPGETLSGLARRYGVSVQALQQANNLASPRDLKAGQRLRIPA